MKRIIFFSKNLKIGGMEKALVNLLNNLIEFYNITLVLEEKEGVLLKDLNENIIVQEYKLSKNKNKYIRKTKNFIKRLCWAILNKNKYDFSCNYATYSVIGSRLAQVSSRNSAFYIHSNYCEVYKDNKKQITEFFKPHKIENFRNIVFVSNESKQKMEKIYPCIKDKFIVINNLIDYKNINLKAKEKCDIKFSKNSNNFIFIGRLDNESKNLDLLINSFKSVIAKDNKNKLLIVGNGPYKKELEKFIKKNNLNKNIELINETANPYPYLLNSDCLILTSNYEGFPVVYLEALVLNKKIMSTIMCSDESINIEEYAIKLEKNIDSITENILKFKKEDKNNNIDFEQLNKIKINKIKAIIER